MLFMVAFASLILGMGVPTTANYIIVSSLMAPVVVELGAQSGLIVPLIAVHMFVFYFGIMADVTPPVGLAAYAAAGIAKSPPLLTSFYRVLVQHPYGHPAVHVHLQYAASASRSTLAARGSFKTRMASATAASFGVRGSLAKLVHHAQQVVRDRKFRY